MSPSIDRSSGYVAVRTPLGWYPSAKARAFSVVPGAIRKDVRYIAEVSLGSEPSSV